MDVGKNDELVLRVQTGGPMEELVKGLKQRKGVKVGGSPRRTSFTIKGMDLITSKQEVDEVFKIIAGGEAINVDPLRPVYGGKQAATITVEQGGWIRRLGGSVLIGMGLCRIIEWTEEEDKCFRCWEPGHWAASCTVPDRKDLCKRCGKRI